MHAASSPVPRTGLTPGVGAGGMEQTETDARKSQVAWPSDGEIAALSCAYYVQLNREAGL